MSMIPIDEVVETWIKARKEALAACAHDDDLGWWREAMAHLRPTPEDDAPTLDDENA
jgi:hypothetical protein